MTLTVKIPINCKISFPKKLPQGLLEPILKPLWRGPKTGGTVLSDRMALHKSLLLCKQCEFKANVRHLKKQQYEELQQFHAMGLCDLCQNETSCSMWMWQGSAHIQSQAMQGQWDKVRA